MIQFLVGMAVGVIITLFGLAVWTVFEEDKENKKEGHHEDE